MNNHDIDNLLRTHDRPRAEILNFVGVYLTEVKRNSISHPQWDPVDLVVVQNVKPDGASFMPNDLPQIELRFVLPGKLGFCEGISVVK